MPLVAGISLISLETGSPATVQLLSTEDTTYTHTFTQQVLDSSNLTSTFEAIAAALPEKTAQATLAVPSYIPESERKVIARAAHKVRIFRTIWLAENIQLVKPQLDLDPATPVRNELFVEVTSDVAFARLLRTEVEEGIRSSETLIEAVVSLSESSVNTDAAQVAAALVNPALVALKTSPPSEAGFDLKNIIIVSTDTALVLALTEKVKEHFAGGNIIVLPSEYAKYAAKNSLIKYQDFLDMDQMFITNVVPLRVGIAKADGFVLTALGRNTTLPQEKSLLLTTSTDNQKSATVKIVVGISPVAKDNTAIAELVLKGLKSRPRGETVIKVSFYVEQLGKTTITAEEVNDGSSGGAKASVELENVLGNELFSDDVEDFLEGLPALSGNPAASEAEDRWAGEKAQGDLPQ